MSHVIGIDLGSQSLKAVLVDPDGREIGSAARTHAFSARQAGWAEEDPNAWWEGLRSVVADLLSVSSIAPAEVSALALASQVDGLVPVDEAGTPLQPAIIWFDRRAERQAAQLATLVSATRLFEVTGLNLDSSHVAPKMLWLREERPEVWRRTSRLHLPGSWMVERLTGASVVDHSNASSTLLYDVTARSWSPELLGATGIAAEMLPRVAAATDVAGRLTPHSAAELGLTPGCLVAVGAGDEHAASLAAGVLGPGPVCDIAGTAEPVAVASASPIFDPDHLVETHAHADPASWLIENPGFVSGGSVRWLGDVLGVVSAAELVALAEPVDPGSDGVTFLPALSGAMTPRWNGNARGVFSGLSMATGRGHLARAVFEGCAYGVRDIVDRFDSLGLATEELRVAGGGTRSEALVQLKADVVGRRCRRVATPEATAFGAAMIGLVATGRYASLREAAEAMVRLDERVYEPDRERHQRYEDSYRAYRRLFDAVEPMFGASPAQ